jgi:hypothetical protein
MTRTFRLIVKETLTHEVEVEAASLKDVPRAYEQACFDTEWSSLHKTIGQRLRVTRIQEVQS